MATPSSVEKWGESSVEKEMVKKLEDQKQSSLPFRSKKNLSQLMMTPECKIRRSQSSDLSTPDTSTPVDKEVERYRKRRFVRSLSEVKKISKEICAAKDKTKKKEAADSISCEDDFGGKSTPKRREIEKLPPKFQSLYDCFRSMLSTLQILSRKNYASTFQNVRASMETLTGRAFSYSHLAQFKHVLSEVMQLKTIFVLDEKTSCMKPEILIALMPASVEREGVKATADDYSLLQMELYSRLSALCKSMKEDDDIPEEVLPEPFNQKSFTTNHEEIPKSTLHSRNQATGELSAETTLVPDLGSFRSSFRKSFSQKVLIPESEKTELACLSTASISNSDPVGIAKPQEPTPARLISNTPQLQTPKRARFTPPNASLSCCSTGNLLLQRKKKLVFSSPMKANEKRSAVRNSVDESIISTLSLSFLQSIEAKATKKLDDGFDLIAAVELRRKTIHELPKLFDTLLLVFQSANCAVMTKQQLLYKIMVQQCDIADQREIESQLNILQELLPDWISCKTSLSGDSMYCIRKNSDSMSLRARLVEAAMPPNIPCDLDS